ncbi:hypothetical protein [Burkholderia alba]|uniref:hypothetical protein n=1 Tax=Burkholderia alba TaxID=2683677 RepID=UPI002B05AE9B|nr:hypothetical protein [Burkholderia alba]
MLRWLIAVLFLANMLAFAAMRGMFGPLPAAGPREPDHLAQQVRADTVRVTAVAQASDQPVVGGPIEQPTFDAVPIGGASTPDAASMPNMPAPGASAPTAGAPASAAQ